MSALLDYMRLCRLCLVKDKVNVPIFGSTSDVRQIFLKISACLPVKVSQDDNLPKSICDSCQYKIDLLYQFWNTTVNAEKQLIQWITEIGVDVNIKDTNPPSLQSHAHPHSMSETMVLKQERPDPDIKNMEQIETKQDSMYSAYAYQPQIKMTVGAPTDFTQPSEAEEDIRLSDRRQTQFIQPSPAKRRGRPPKQATTASSDNKVTPAATTSTATSAVTNSKRRSSAAAAAAAVAAAVASMSSDESDMDDRLGGDDSDDEDMDVPITKEEADSDDEEYVDNPEALEPTAFVGFPSGSADSDQPGPSGLGGGSTTGKMSSSPVNNTANESGPLPQTMVPALQYRIIGYMPLTNLLNPHRCTKCDKRFPDHRKLKNHGRIHHSVDKPCPVCGRLFRSKYNLDKHVKVIHDKLGEKVVCELCNKKLSKSALALHLQRFHVKDFKIKCMECEKMFVSKQEYQAHMDVIHRGIRYICFPCNKTFRSPAYLNIHRREKHDPTFKPVERKCPQCGKSFVRAQTLTKHIAAAHDNIQSNCICDVCGKVLGSLTSLRDHKMIHTGDKPFVCHVCGKAFNKKGLLATHNLTHTKEKPHKCPTCEKCFSQRSSLTIHMRYHTGERPYVCNICNKKYVSKSQMKLHLKVHGTSSAEIIKEIKIEAIK